MDFDYTPLFRKDLAGQAAPWAGFPKYNFVGGHNDPDSIPAADLAEAAKQVLLREGQNLATYQPVDEVGTGHKRPGLIL